MKKKRLKDIFKGFLVCAAAALGIAGLLFLGVITLFSAFDLLLTWLISYMPRMV